MRGSQTDRDREGETENETATLSKQAIAYFQ